MVGTKSRKRNLAQKSDIPLLFGSKELASGKRFAPLVEAVMLPRLRGVLEDEYCAHFSSSVFTLLIRPGFCSLSPQKRVKIRI
jgi:hypothetical protein